MKIIPLKAAHGDAIVVQFSSDQKEHTIVIDGGPSVTAESIVNIYTQLGYIDILILTHYDEDHISGVLEYVSSLKHEKKECIGQIWVNGANLIYYDDEQNVSVYEDAFNLASCLNRMQKKGVVGQWLGHVTNDMNPIEGNGFRIDVLSPTTDILYALEKEFKHHVESHGLDDDPDTEENISSANVFAEAGISLEDLAQKKISIRTSFMNRTSIAFLLQAEGKSVLFMGDADPDVVSCAIMKMQSNGTFSTPLHVDLMKISHHGSKANIREDFLKLLDCQNVLFTTNGGSGNGYHPSRTTLAYLWKFLKNIDNKKLNLFFNYPFAQILERNTGLLSDKEKKLFSIIDHNKSCALTVIEL